MDTEHDRQRGEQEMIVAPAEVPAGVDADCSYRNAADKISLRREAHGEPYRKPVGVLGRAGLRYIVWSNAATGST